MAAGPAEMRRNSSFGIKIPGNYSSEWDLDPRVDVPEHSVAVALAHKQEPNAQKQSLFPSKSSVTWSSAVASASSPSPEHSPTQFRQRQLDLAQSVSATLERSIADVSSTEEPVYSYNTAQVDRSMSLQSSRTPRSLNSTRKTLYTASSVLDRLSAAKPSSERRPFSPRTETTKNMPATPDEADNSNHWIWRLLTRTTVATAPQESHALVRRSRRDLGTESDDGRFAHCEVTASEPRRSEEQHNISSAISKVIADMESLLNGAMLIAKQAAEISDGTDVQSTVRDAGHAQIAEPLKPSVAEKPGLIPANESKPEAPKAASRRTADNSKPDVGMVSVAVPDSKLAITCLDDMITVDEPIAGRSDSLPAQSLSSSEARYINAQYIASRSSSDDGVTLEPKNTSVPTESSANNARDFQPGEIWTNCNVQNGDHNAEKRREYGSESLGYGEPRMFSDMERQSRNSRDLWAFRHHKNVSKKSSNPRADNDQKAKLQRNRSSSIQRSFNHVSEDGEPTLHSIHEDSRPEAQRQSSRRGRMSSFQRSFSLTDRHHVSIRDSRRFHLSRTHRRSKVARDWSTARKRMAATIACMSTALIGTVIGIYAGEVPAIQYQLADEHHSIILGNAFLYIGLAIPTLFFWSLPLLHGRKPYTLLALSIFLPLQLPQAVIVSTSRDPGVSAYRVSLLLARAASGLALGFANINFKSTLLDLFGASLQSSHPHQEVVHEHDIRRRGGGMGIWLGIWSWCHTGSIGVGFLFGALLTSGNPAWGFWVTVLLTATVLLLNVLMPEVRRSSHRRSMAEIWNGVDVTRRVARGEIMMHLFSTGPKWWWQEVKASISLMGRMLSQPGFFVLAMYVGWVYAQIVMTVILLGALMSRYYRFRPPYVGACVSALPIGALLAVPFEKASLFSRSRKQGPRTDSMTFEKRISWSSHLVRRAIFMVALPFAGLGYTVSSGGPPIHYMWPTFFAGLIGFLSNLAISECNGLIMETYDTSDLQPGMTGRPVERSDEVQRDPRRTKFTCYPRVIAALAITQALGFLLAGAATGVGGTLERRLGAELATGVVAVILLSLTFMLIVVLWRSNEVQVIPSSLTSLPQAAGTAGTGEDWRPIIIGHPSGKMRRMSVLELGSQSRWTEIRRHNKLLDA